MVVIYKYKHKRNNVGTKLKLNIGGRCYNYVF